MAEKYGFPSVFRPSVPTLRLPQTPPDQWPFEEAQRRSTPTESPLSRYLSLLGTAGGAYASQDATNRMAESNPSSVAQTARNFLHADYIAGGGSGNRPTNTQLGLPTFGIGPQGSSPDAMAMAQRMKAELAKRDISGMKKPGFGERFAGILSAASPFLSLIPGL